jgi:ABC-type sugar transport system permease subunit
VNGTTTPLPRGNQLPISALTRERRPRLLDRVSVEAAISGVTAWHIVGAIATALGLLATFNPEGEQLPTTVFVVVVAAHIGALLGNVYAAATLRSLKPSGRTVSLSTNYLVFIIATSAALHQLGAFTAIDAFGGGFNKGFLAFLVGVVGLGWFLVADLMAKKAPAAGGPAVLKLMAQVVLIVAGVWFVIAADPTGMLAAIGNGLTRPLTLGVILVALGSGIACALMWRPTMALQFDTSAETERTLTGLAFLSPNILGFMAFFAFPLAFSLYVSTFDWSTTGGSGDFVGLDNYIRALSLDVASAPAPNAGIEVLKSGYQVLFHLDWFGQNWVIGARDVEFWLSLRNILVFLVLAVPLSVLPGLFLSSILASRLPGMKVFRAIYFIPSVAGVVGVSIIWNQMFDATVGWINYLLLRAGEILPFVDPPAEGQPWLTESGTALFAIIVVFAWMNFGFNTVLYLAGHQGIPKELYEAAEIDGASTWQTFRRITVPQLKNTTFYVVATTSILALQLFDIVWVLSKPEPGGPNNATSTPVLTLYEEAFQSSNQGYASALAWVLFLLIFGLTFVQFRRQRDEATAGGVS